MDRKHHIIAGALTAVVAPSLLPVAVLYYGAGAVKGAKDDESNGLALMDCGNACQQFWNGLFYGAGYWFTWWMFNKYGGL